MKNPFSKVSDLKPGAYLIRNNLVVNYGAKIASGYAVPLRELHTKDLKASTLFTVALDGEENDYMFANHVESLQGAKLLARSTNQSRVYDLRAGDWVAT